MPTGSYEPVPTDLEIDDSSTPLPKPSGPRFSSIHRLLFLSVTFCLVAFLSFKAGQWSVIHRESGIPEKAPQTSPGHDDTTIPDITHNSTGMSGKYSVGYFVNWGIYGRKYPPALIPTQDLTHILYAFANIKADTGEVFLSDSWADQEIHYPGDSWSDTGKNLYGNFKALYNLKKQNRHLKVLLSIGGWTYSPTFHPIVINPALRSKFVASAIRLLEDNGLDGLDVDYEYPQTDAQARGYVDLLRELRHGLDEHAKKKGANYKFLLTIAAPCGPDNYKKLHVAAMDQYLDLWNMMAYDFSGSWDKIANHQANLYGGPISVSFDSEQVGHWKGEWIKHEGLAGSMFWELSGDKGTNREGMEGGPGKQPQPGRSLVTVVKEAMGPLDNSPNWLRYEGSQFDNMRKGME
ncbi:glycoside hydrolase [Panus rudis PR-1116 ss-1]|nr:glycoside hydrolase [Panus rudis PR-1116 ss-1]